MISKRTVLIIGAGASDHLGYPVGSQLINQIVSLPGTEIFKNIYNEEVIKNFQFRLKRYGSYSIDDFLENNREFIEMGKSFIAYCLKKYEDEDKLFPPYNSGWYQYLFNKMLPSSDEQFENNKITIITFNYDRSLEAYLHNTIMHRFNQSEADSLNILRKIGIIHPHGMLGGYPEIPYSQCWKKDKELNEEDTQLLEKITNSIKIIHEISEVEDTFCSNEFEIAHKALQKTEKIYFLGFGFHEDNIRRFRFFSEDNLEGKEVYSTSKGFREPIEKTELLSRTSKYGLKENFINHSGVDCDYFFKRVGNFE